MISVVFEWTAAVRINRSLRHVHISQARTSGVQSTTSTHQTDTSRFTGPPRECGTPVQAADAQKLMGGVDASGKLRVLDNIVDAQGNPILVPGIGIDLDRFCSWLPDKDVPGLSLAAHKGSHPGCTGAVADKLGEIGRERAARIRLAVASLTEPEEIAQAIIAANRNSEEGILRLQQKIRMALSKPLTLHRDIGHATSVKVLEAWKRALR